MEINNNQNQIEGGIYGFTPQVGSIGAEPAIKEPAAMEIGGDAVTLVPKQQIRRNVPRYVVIAGDLMPEATKRNWRRIEGSQLGGKWFDLTDIPCLWKFQGFVTRGRITPLLQNAIQAFQAEEIVKKKAEEVAQVREATGEMKEMPSVYRTVFPYDSLQSLINEPYGNQGFVEVAILEGVSWDLRIVQEIQTFIFPDWDDHIKGDKALPFTVREFVAHIVQRQAATEDATIKEVCDAFQASADKFKIYAEEIVDKAKEAFARGMNDRGYLAPIPPYARHLAAQIEVSVETADIGRSFAATLNASRVESTEELELRRREIKAKEEELQLKRIELGLDDLKGQQNNNKTVIESPSDEEETVTQLEFAIGQNVVVPGDSRGANNRYATIIRKPFGRLQVQCEDGTIATFDKSDVMPV